MTLGPHELANRSRGNGTLVNTHRIPAPRVDVATVIAILQTHPLAQHKAILQLIEPLQALDNYQWRVNEHHTKALTWLTAARAARMPQELTFFLTAILDIYDYDRATGAVLNHNLPQPIKKDKVPAHRLKDNQSTPYELHWYKLTNLHDPPYDAVTDIAEVLLDTPPDEFEVADYIRRTTYTHWDPVVYARYGSWYVEVAQWE